jgi:dihydroorotate dehydrogenase (fumarate)
LSTAHGQHRHTLKRLEAAGASVAVLPSLFEEQVEHDEAEIHALYEFQTESYAESLTHFPELDDYNTGPDRYLRYVEEAKNVLTILVIGSLNAGSDGAGFVMQS